MPDLTPTSSSTWASTPVTLSLNFIFPISQLVEVEVEAAKSGFLNQPHEVDSKLPQLHTSAWCHNSSHFIIIV